MAASADVEEQQERQALLGEPRQRSSNKGLLKRMVTFTSAPEEVDEEQLRVQLWEQHENETEPAFFAELTIAHDGGLGTEIKRLEEGMWMRYLSACAVIFFAIYNSCYTVWLDIGLILKDTSAYRKMFMIVASFFTTVVNRFLWAIGHREEFEWYGSKLIGIAELAVLIFLLGQIVHTLYVVHCSPIVFKQWLWMGFLAWDYLPRLAVFSAMGLLYYVNPVVISQALSQELYNLMGDSEKLQLNRYTLWRIVRFVAFRAFCAIVGFDAFLLKFREVSAAAHTPMHEMNLLKFMSIVMFVVQLLGVSRLSVFMKDRLFIFIFAGEDAIMTKEEEAAQDIFNALLVKRIWEEHSSPKHLFILLSFSDVDFQQLVLNEVTCGRPAHGQKDRTAKSQSPQKSRDK